MPRKQLDLSSIRARLAQTSGPHYWRSLEELADTDAFKAFLYREFPVGAAEMHNPVSRRRFLKLMGASMALAGLTACTQNNGVPPDQQIVPYVEAPERIVPGKPLFFATALQFNGFGRGVLAESHMGRPTKIEGNPNHPASLGATDVFGQAAILTFYDPDRSQVVRNRGQIATWDSFLSEIIPQMQALTQGQGLRLLTETVTSPTLFSQIEQLLAAYPQARRHQYDPVGRDNVRAGARLAFDQDVSPIYNFAQAERILALDADFLLHDPGSLRYARQFMQRRQIREEPLAMNRLYVIESSPTITGAMADHRLVLRAGQIADVARAIAQALGIELGDGEANIPAGIPAGWIEALVEDLQASGASSLVVAGIAQPPAVHALADAINAALGSIGNTVEYIAPVAANPVDQTASLRELVQDMQAGQVDMLVILSDNPVYTAPADLDFAAALENVELRIHHGLYHNETARLCHWHIPQTHELESWSDLRAFDGTATIIQPLIAPLYDGHSVHELLAVLLEQPFTTSYEIVRGYWANQVQAGDVSFDTFWETALHDGVVAGTAATPVEAELRADFAGQLAQVTPVQPGEIVGLEINFRPDPTIWDGRYANNGWLQETPKPLTTITWGNAVLISINTAERFNLANEDLVELRYRERSVRGPVWIMPGHPDDAVTVHLGYGRSQAGLVGGDGDNTLGFNAYSLRTSDAPWFDTGLELLRIGTQEPIATTQNHFAMEGRKLVETATLEEFRANPHFIHGDGPAEEELPSLYPEFEYPGNAWGMAIDLNACIGCNACLVACQAENNIPIVGKEGVKAGREMHWLKIDRYYEGEDVYNPAVYFQPRPCMHCEKAPCELVCPVAATVHDSEGLNMMIYNRCVGTRYCSNNCPYKVRRFNFFQYANQDTPVIQLMHNPDVTVRTRGVMEKCTYCVQRISSARIEAKKEERPIRDGEVWTACQQACPTRAITFGDINNPDSRVTQLKALPQNYGLLRELGTRPRTSYLARFRNPNPAVEEGTA